MRPFFKPCDLFKIKEEEENLNVSQFDDIIDLQNKELLRLLFFKRRQHFDKLIEGNLLLIGNLLH